MSFEDVADLSRGIFGLAGSLESSDLVIHPVGWDLTCSFGVGAAGNLSGILEASGQLDLWDLNGPVLCDETIFLGPADQDLLALNMSLRSKASAIYSSLEAGQGLLADQENDCNDIESACKEMKHCTQKHISSYLDQGKKVILLGGDHSVSLAYVRALAKRYDSFGVLQLDAHMDFRDSYAGFKHSHATVMRRISELPQVEQIVQVGIRDCAESEVDYARSKSSLIQTFFDDALQARLFEGETWQTICREIVDACPDNLYITTDIDGLDPRFCPSTGTPVPGGLTFTQWIYLLWEFKRQNKTIIGMDLVEVVSGTPWDSNVAARLLHQYALVLLN